MIALPHSTHDLLLAPVVLAVSERIEELSSLSVEELALQVAISGDTPDLTADFRRTGLLRTICHLIDLHDWHLAWDGKDLRLSRRRYSVVLGVPPQFLEYINTPARTAHRL